jgi:hypothetical protein
MAKKKGNGSNAIIYRGFFHLHRPLLMSEDFQALKGNTIKLLICIGAQYNGRNNGDLCAAPTVLKKFGWHSSSNQQLTKCIKELVARDMIMQTKQGGLNMGPNLYAITWQPIDTCDGKLDIGPTARPSRSFQK